jgi:ankyrin repeat protein
MHAPFAATWAGLMPLADALRYACRHVAAAAGNCELIKVLLEKSDEDAENSQTGNTPLWAAVEGGHLEAARVLLEAGCDASLACEGGATALHAAAGADCDDLVALLLEHGAAVSGQQAWGGEERSTCLSQWCIVRS